LECSAAAVALLSLIEATSDPSFVAQTKANSPAAMAIAAPKIEAFQRIEGEVSVIAFSHRFSNNRLKDDEMIVTKWCRHFSSSGNDALGIQRDF
jgi:hypothetical protein